MDHTFIAVDENNKKENKKNSQLKNWYSILKGLLAGLGKVIRPEASIILTKEIIKPDRTIIKYTFRCKYR
jgi:hypothetical protein